MPIFTTWCTVAPYVTKWLSGGPAAPLAPLWRRHCGMPFKLSDSCKLANVINEILGI